ncbi:type III secretion system inner rod subunit SctI [Chitinimonas lacunae]|uniref:Type III secretion system inner rod subunit SctI n=1 Tax=Chitinimonas lacunae TaxID=1963018 RepID=A0ABV8MSU9_9NEIS
MDIPVTALASLTTPSVAPAALPAADVPLTEQQYFQQLLNTSSVPTSQAVTPAGATATTAPATVGDAILDGLRGVSRDFQQRWQKVDATLSDPAKLVSVTDMLRLQSQMLQLSVQYEMVGKAVSRSTQNIEQLIKIQ